MFLTKCRPLRIGNQRTKARPTKIPWLSSRRYVSNVMHCVLCSITQILIYEKYFREESIDEHCANLERHEL